MKTYTNNKALIAGEAETLASFGITERNYFSAMKHLKEVCRSNTKALEYAKNLANIILASQLEKRITEISDDVDALFEIAMAESREDLLEIQRKIENTEIAKEESEFE